MSKKITKGSKRNRKSDKAKYGVNVKVKDTLFRNLFGTEAAKIEMLSLYNALRGTEYTDVSALEIYTIGNAIFMGYKNDIGFILDGYLSLWEHQSTKNPNMPLRGLFYHARMYEKYVKANNLDIYTSTLKRIPAPQYYVFYNGDESAEDVETLKLSDSFMNPVEPGTFEWTATMLNINLGHNKELMEKCKVLKEYAIFVEKIKDGVRNLLPVREAIEVAVDWCIENDILKEYLIKHKSEVIGMILSEYDEKKHIKNEKQISWEEGRIEGKIEGKIEGRIEGENLLARLINKLLSVGKGNDIPKVTTDQKYRQELYDQYGIK